MHRKAPATGQSLKEAGPFSGQVDSKRRRDSHGDNREDRRADQTQSKARWEFHITRL